MLGSKFIVPLFRTYVQFVDNVRFMRVCVGVCLCVGTTLMDMNFEAAIVVHAHISTKWKSSSFGINLLKSTYNTHHLETLEKKGLLVVAVQSTEPCLTNETCSSSLPHNSVICEIRFIYALCLVLFNPDVNRIIKKKNCTFTTVSWDRLCMFVCWEPFLCHIHTHTNTSNTNVYKRNEVLLSLP